VLRCPRDGRGGSRFRWIRRRTSSWSTATRAAEVYRLAGASYLIVGADEQGRVHAETIDARFRTVAGPRLRVECAGESRDV